MTELYKLTYNQHFIHKGVNYTVKQQSFGMAEIFANGRLWAWPHYNGKEPVKVFVVYDYPKRESHETKLLSTDQEDFPT